MIITLFASLYLFSISYLIWIGRTVAKMAHRGETLHKHVSCIADLKALGSKNLPVMVKGILIKHASWKSRLLTISRLLQWRSNGSYHVWALIKFPGSRLTYPLARLRENEEAFNRYKIRPRILVNVDQVDTSMEILGTKVTLPLGFSPAASQRLAHPDGEVGVSRAAAKYGICMGLSSYSNYSLEDVVGQGSGNPYVMQMCVLRDRSITVQLLERAESMLPFYYTPGLLLLANLGIQRLVTRRFSFRLTFLYWGSGWMNIGMSIHFRRICRGLISSVMEAIRLAGLNMVRSTLNILLQS